MLSRGRECLQCFQYLLIHNTMLYISCNYVVLEFGFAIFKYISCLFVDKFAIILLSFKIYTQLYAFCLRNVTQYNDGQVRCSLL